MEENYLVLRLLDSSKYGPHSRILYYIVQSYDIKITTTRKQTAIRDEVRMQQRVQYTQ